MTSMILSIIVPIYNVEKYISSCIKSILSQICKREDVELILINDGTPDQSANIANHLINNFELATMVHQRNQGLSKARNNGLLQAKGKYVWFIDSDDSICNNCIEGIILSLENNPDLLQLNYQKVYDDGRDSIPIIANVDYDLLLSGKKTIANHQFPIPAQFTIYRREFLLANNLSFVPGIFHEDSEFKPRAIYLAKSIMWHKPIVYNYLQRTSGSITSNYKLKNGLDAIKVNESLHSFYLKSVKEPECKIGFRKCIATNINTLLMGIRELDKHEQHEIINALKQKKHLLKDMIFSGNMKYSIEGILLLLNIPTAIKLHSFIR